MAQVVHAASPSRRGSRASAAPERLDCGERPAGRTGGQERARPVALTQLLQEQQRRLAQIGAVLALLLGVTTGLAAPWRGSLSIVDAPPSPSSCRRSWFLMVMPGAVRVGPDRDPTQISSNTAWGTRASACWMTT